MSKRHDAQRLDDAPAYLSLREAVRPAIFAYSLVAAEHERAGALVAECENLIDATRELLRAVGLTHLLKPREGPEVRGDARSEDGPTLLDAYASAGMLWAEIVGKSLILAERLIGQDRQDDVMRLAAVLNDAGEPSAAAGLQYRIAEAAWRKYEPQLRFINSELSLEDIRRATRLIREALRDVPENFPSRNAEVCRLLTPLAASMLRILRARNTYASYGQLNFIATGNGAEYPQLVDQYIEQIAGEFESTLSTTY